MHYISSTLLKLSPALLLATLTGCGLINGIVGELSEDPGPGEDQGIMMPDMDMGVDMLSPKSCEDTCSGVCINVDEITGWDLALEDSTVSYAVCASDTQSWTLGDADIVYNESTRTTLNNDTLYVATLADSTLHVYTLDLGDKKVTDSQSIDFTSSDLELLDISYLKDRLILSFISARNGMRGFRYATLDMLTESPTPDDSLAGFNFREREQTSNITEFILPDDSGLYVGAQDDLLVVSGLFCQRDTPDLCEHYIFSLEPEDQSKTQTYMATREIDGSNPGLDLAKTPYTVSTLVTKDHIATLTLNDETNIMHGVAFGEGDPTERYNRTLAGTDNNTFTNCDWSNVHFSTDIAQQQLLHVETSSGSMSFAGLSMLENNSGVSTSMAYYLRTQTNTEVKCISLNEDFTNARQLTQVQGTSSSLSSPSYYAALKAIPKGGDAFTTLVLHQNVNIKEVSDAHSAVITVTTPEGTNAPMEILDAQSSRSGYIVMTSSSAPSSEEKEVTLVYMTRAVTSNIATDTLVQ